MNFRLHKLQEGVHKSWRKGLRVIFLSYTVIAICSTCWQGRKGFKPSLGRVFKHSVVCGCNSIVKPGMVDYRLIALLNSMGFNWVGFGLYRIC